MSIFRIVTIVAVALTIAIAAPLPGRADEISQQQEAKRAPLRAAYVKAKQAEKDALDRRQNAIDRMSALLLAGNSELGQIQKDLAAAKSRLDDKQQERKLAAKALDAALGSHDRDAGNPAVKDAQAKLDALDTALADLDKQVANLEQAQRDKISIPNADPIYKEYVDASGELDRRRQDVVKALALYLAAMRPEAPPYLQSVQIYAGAKAMYRAEWRIDDQAADTATHELTGRLQKIIDDAREALEGMEEEHDDLTKRRQILVGPMQRLSAEIVKLSDRAEITSYALIVGPAVVEACGVVLEAVLTGGTSTAERYATEQAVDAGTKVADALAKKYAGKTLSAAEQAMVGKVGKLAEDLDEMHGLAATLGGKYGSDLGMNARGNDLVDNVGLPSGLSAATKIVVSDAAEQVIQRTAKAAVVTVDYKLAAALTASGEETIGNWRAIRAGTKAFYSAKPSLSTIKETLSGTRSANVLGLSITVAKAVMAAYLGNLLGTIQQQYAEDVASLDFMYSSYYVLLKADRVLLEKQRDLQSLFFETFAYRLKSAGPRKLVVLQNDASNAPDDTLTFALHFSEPLDHAPQVRILGLQLDMRPQDKGADGRSAIWQGKLAPEKLPDNVKEGVLEVRLGLGSKPYLELDADPTTPARFNLPDDLTKDLPDREEWSDYDRGPDKSHRVAFAGPQAQLPVPWRGHSTCEQINCDCGAVPITPGIGGDTGRKLCLNNENALRQDCAKRGQTLNVCSNGGPKAYPPGGRTAPTPRAPDQPPLPPASPRPVIPNPPPR